MFSNDLLKPLIEFLLTNIHKFRIILECKESYYISIPKDLPSAKLSSNSLVKAKQIEAFKRPPMDQGGIKYSSSMSEGRRSTLHP